VNESPSIFARMRAGLAGLLGGMAAGARWLEDRTAGSMRPWLLGAAALAIGGVMLFGVVHAWHGDHRPGGRYAEHHVGPPPVGKPEPKPEGRPERRSEVRSEGRFEGGAEAGRFEARPPLPAPPPPPPPPPSPPSGSRTSNTITAPN
jgi:hypothetical protein